MFIAGNESLTFERAEFTANFPDFQGLICRPQLRSHISRLEGNIAVTGNLENHSVNYLRALLLDTHFKFVALILDKRALFTRNSSFPPGFRFLVGIEMLAKLPRKLDLLFRY